MTHVDLPAVQRLSLELGYEVTVDALAPRLAQLLHRDDEQVLVAVGSEVLGWSHASAVWALESPPGVELRALVVCSASRRAGVGRALVEAVDRWRVERGFSVLRVRSNVARGEAHTFYPRLGFSLSKTQHVYTRGG